MQGKCRFVNLLLILPKSNQTNNHIVLTQNSDCSMFMHVVILSGLNGRFLGLLLPLEWSFACSELLDCSIECFSHDKALVFLG